MIHNRWVLIEEFIGTALFQEPQAKEEMEIVEDESWRNWIAYSYIHSVVTESDLRLILLSKNRKRYRELDFSLV